MTQKGSCLISKIEAEEIRDSHGNPTIKVSVFAGEHSGSFSVPSGASTGSHEAHELRDQDGSSVKNAIGKVNNDIAKALVSHDIFDQKGIDEVLIKLDGTKNKNNLGGNSMIGTSIACAKAAAAAKGIEVFEHLRTLVEIKPSRKTPYLFMNLLEGGKHTKSGLAFQEYHAVPDTENVANAVDIGNKIQNALREIIDKDLGEGSTVSGDEGGFAPNTNDVRKPLIYMSEAIKKNNFPVKVRMALDVAASSFYKNGFYKVSGKEISSEELQELYSSLLKDFDIFSVEDPFDQEDFDDFRKFKENNKGIFVVGDDLTVSNQALLKKAIEGDSINAMIIKPNQIGTLSETLDTMRLARENGIELIVSHRGEETDDDFIADLAYAYGCFGLKAGSPQKPERMVKYKRLMNIINSQENPV